MSDPSLFQYTVVGLNTEIGVNALKNVKLELRPELGPALTLHQLMVEMSVLGRGMRFGTAILKRVQVMWNVDICEIKTVV